MFRLKVDTVAVNKLEAATRQLDAAIRLLFAGEDIVAVHTLAGAASAVLTNLIDIELPRSRGTRSRGTLTSLTRTSTA